MMPAAQFASTGSGTVARRVERPKLRLAGRRASIEVQLGLEKLLTAAVIEQAFFLQSIRNEVLSGAIQAFRVGVADLLPSALGESATGGLRLYAERIAALLAAAAVLGKVQVRREADLPLRASASVTIMAEALDGVAPQRAIEYLRSLPVLTRAEWERAIATQRARAFTMAGVQQRQVLEGMRELIARALESGLTPQQFERAAGELLRNYQFEPTRIRTIFNTNVGQALANGRDEELRAVTDVLPWRLFDAMNDGFVRPNHRAGDNAVAPAAWWDGPGHELKPLLGFNCRCVLLGITAARARKLRGNATPARSFIETDSPCRNSIDPRCEAFTS